MTDFQKAMFANMPESCYKSKAKLLDLVLQTWGKKVANEPAHVFWVPGRIEVLGKHTDYCGGRSLLAAASRGFVFAVRSREDQKITVCDAASGECIETKLDPDLQPQIGHWSNYPETVFRRIARNYPGTLLGGDIVFASDLPPASGMSSSSALMVGFFLVMNKINQLDDREEFKANIKTAEDLAGYLGTLENGQTFGSLVGDKGVGTFGGSEDHTAIMNCQNGQLSQYGYCPVRFERKIVLPDDYSFAIGVSGVIAEKTGAAMTLYNRASGLAFEGLAVWNKTTNRQDPHLAGAIAACGVDAIREVLVISKSSQFLSQDLVRRFDHFVVENETVLPNAGDALASGDLAEFGRWVNTSQEKGVALLKNQIPETEGLAKLAVDLGAVGASAFGAGFGGSVWALVNKKDMASFLEEWQISYREKFPQHQSLSQFFEVDASPGAFELKS